MSIENRETPRDWWEKRPPHERDAGKNPTNHTVRKLYRRRVLAPRRTEAVDWVTGFMPPGMRIDSFKRFVDAYDQQSTPNGREPAPIEEPLATE